MVDARVATAFSRCKPSIVCSTGLVLRRSYPYTLKFFLRDDSPTASTTTKLPGADTCAASSMSFCCLWKYGRNAFEATLAELEMMLIGTSEYTMYLFDTFPALNIALYSTYKDAKATHRASAMTFA